MAYTVSFPHRGDAPNIDDVATWLTENGEPFTQQGAESLQLRAVPITIVVRETGTTRAHMEISADVKLDRMVEVLYNFALHIGADVHLSDAGKITRGELWLRLADEQDRHRVAEALERADSMGKKAGISRALWGVLAAVVPGRDVRWDAKRACVVELLEVGDANGISHEEACWHCEDPQMGDIVARPLEQGYPHITLWRWLSESHPSLTNA